MIESELTLFLLRIGFLALLWVFIFIVIYALRSDLFGTRLTRLQQSGAAAPAPASAPAKPSSPDAATTITSVARGSGGNAPRTAPAPIARRIVITGGPRSGMELDLPETGLTMGRSSGSGLQIKDDYTSSNHARLVLRGGQWTVEDLGSTNGTFVAGKRVTGAVAVSPGTEVKIGTTTFELRR